MSNIKCILIVLTLVTPIFCSPGRDNLNYIDCNGSRYNRSSTGCCIEENGSESVYDKTNKFCCGHKLYTKVEGKCCGNINRKASKKYDPKEKLCCNGELIKRLANHSCCGNKIYDITKEECCETKTYHQDIEKCIENIIVRIDEDICNGTRYNLTKNYCCNGKLTGQIFRDGVICCGHKFMFIDKDMCCDGEVFKMGTTEKCCGKKVINTISGCCDGKEYNPKLHICHEGKIRVALEKCFSIPYNSEKQICCGYIIINKEKDDQDDCCQERLKPPPVPYNSNIQTCSDGKVQSKIYCANSEDLKKYTCCQGLRYNISSHESMCCKRIAEKKPAESLPDGCQSSLCGNKMYNSINSICCKESLINRHKYYCKNGKTFKLFNFNDGLSINNIQICGSYAVKKSKNVGCCIGMPYNKNKIKCPLMWRSNRYQLKPSNYPFWDRIQCKTLRMNGNITRIKPISEKKFRIHFKSGDTDYKVEIRIKTLSIKNKLMKKINNKIAVFYEKMLGNSIILGTYGAISFDENNSIKNIPKDECPNEQEFWK